MIIDKTYTELSKLKTFKERFDYLKLYSNVGDETFGYDRYLNQKLYSSIEWKKVRNYVISRDNGCDLGVPNYDIIDSKIIVHHINPITKNDILFNNPDMFNPEYLITTTMNTHDAIHFGNSEMLYDEPVHRQQNDTCPWKNRRSYEEE